MKLIKEKHAKPNSGKCQKDHMITKLNYAMIESKTRENEPRAKS